MLDRYFGNDLIILLKEAPVLDICVGMQLLFSRWAEFGDFSGLDLVEGSISRMQEQHQLVGSNRIKVPDVGWSSLNYKREELIFSRIDKARLACYFVHSFMDCNVPDENILAVADYCGLKTPPL